MSRSTIPILFSIPNLASAGSRHVLRNLVCGLDRERFEPSVVVLRRGGPVDEQIEREGIPIFEAPFCIEARPAATLPLRVLKAARALRRARPAAAPRIQHSFHYKDDYTEPLIARAAGARSWIYTKKAMGWGSRGWRLRSRLATSIIVDNSEMVGSMFAPARLAGRCRLVHHGVRPADFVGRPNAVPSYRERLRLPRDAHLVVSVADLVPIKGHADLIRAVGELPHCHLALAGGGEGKPHATLLSELSEDLSCKHRIHFLGRIDDVGALLNEADLFVLASRLPGEGCPVALIEAMAAGVPAIATDVPGCREVLDSPALGRLVPAADPDALRAAVAGLLSSPDRRAAYAVAARERVLTEFTVDREVAELSRIYAELSS